MNDITGFPCVGAAGATALILGSIPSVRSLEKHEYYGHPRNAFWPIMAELFGCPAEQPYRDRLAALTGNGIILWDVLRSCRRPGSLDSSIEGQTAVVNDFPGLFQRHDGIRYVFFNGRKAASLFARLVLPGLAAYPGRTCTTLPSTSPAYAAMSFEQKLARWRVIRDVVTAEPAERCGRGSAASARCQR